jgi:hypothetical protein
VRRGDSSRDHPDDAQVRDEVPVGLLKQLKREVELGLGHPLSEEEVGSPCHLPARSLT